MAVLMLDLGAFGWLYQWHDTTVTPDQFEAPAGLLPYRDHLFRPVNVCCPCSRSAPRRPPLPTGRCSGISPAPWVTALWP